MDKARVKDDSKALNRLFKLAVIGSALIIIVYSVYYYSNAYKYSSTNIYYAANQDDIEVHPELVNDVVGESNLLYSANLEYALHNSHGSWSLDKQRRKPQTLYMNERTTVAKCGLVAESFDEVLAREMVQKFRNIPPVLMDREGDGIVNKSIQFEHFMFPTIAMVNWRDTSGTYKTFSFEPDSMVGDIATYENGFEWHSGKDDYVKVFNVSTGDSLGELSFYNRQQYSVVNAPLVDFDIIYEDESHTGLVYNSKHNPEPKKVIESEGELKILVGPSLKQNNIYEIEADGETLDIRPPFVVILTKENADKPYFFGLFVNDKLLLH